MSTCLLTFNPNFPQKLADKASYILHWEARDIVQEHYSLPQILEKHLQTIRSCHAAWAYNLGRLSIDNKSVAAWLTAPSSPSMWWCSLLYERHPKMTPNLYLLYKLLSLEIFCLEKKITRLEVLGHTVKDSLVIQLIRDLCKVHGIAYVQGDLRVNTSPSSPLLATIYKHMPPKLRTYIRTLHWYVTVKRHMPKKALPKESHDQTATIVTYYPNIDLGKAKEGEFVSRYWESLHTLLNCPNESKKDHLIRWLFIRFPQPGLSLKACLKLKETFARQKTSGYTFHYLEELIGFTEFKKALAHYNYIAKQSRKLAPLIKQHFHLPGSKLNFWPLAQADYVESFQGWRCLERCLQNIAFQTYVTAVGSQKFWLYPLENCPWERMLCYQVEKHAPSVILGAQHSTIRPTDLRYFDAPEAFADDSDLPRPSLFLANGQSAAHQWLQAGMPQQYLQVVEALRYLYLTHREPLPAQKPHTLLILTSFFADETKAHIELFRKAQAQGLFKGFKIILKPHPYLPLEPYLPQNHGLTIAHGPMTDYLTPATLVWASNSTTAALEAAVLGLPVAVMQASQDFDLCPIQDLPDLLRTATLEDVEAMLKLTQGPAIPKDYLCLDQSLRRWARLLQ